MAVRTLYKPITREERLARLELEAQLARRTDRALITKRNNGNQGIIPEADINDQVLPPMTDMVVKKDYALRNIKSIVKPPDVMRALELVSADEASLDLFNKYFSMFERSIPSGKSKLLFEPFEYLFEEFLSNASKFVGRKEQRKQDEEKKKVEEEEKKQRKYYEDYKKREKAKLADVDRQAERDRVEEETKMVEEERKGRIKPLVDEVVKFVDEYYPTFNEYDKTAKASEIYREILNKNPKDFSNPKNLLLTSNIVLDRVDDARATAREGKKKDVDQRIKNEISSIIDKYPVRNRSEVARSLYDDFLSAYSSDMSEKELVKILLSTVSKNFNYYNPSDQSEIANELYNKLFKYASQKPPSFTDKDIKKNITLFINSEMKYFHKNEKTSISNKLYDLFTKIASTQGNIDHNKVKDAIFELVDGMNQPPGRKAQIANSIYNDIFLKLAGAQQSEMPQIAPRGRPPNSDEKEYKSPRDEKEYKSPRDEKEYKSPRDEKEYKSPRDEKESKSPRYEKLSKEEEYILDHYLVEWYSSDLQDNLPVDDAKRIVNTYEDITRRPQGFYANRIFDRIMFDTLNNYPYDDRRRYPSMEDKIYNYISSDLRFREGLRRMLAGEAGGLRDFAWWGNSYVHRRYNGKTDDERARIVNDISERIIKEAVREGLIAGEEEPDILNQLIKESGKSGKEDNYPELGEGLSLRKKKKAAPKTIKIRFGMGLDTSAIQSVDINNEEKEKELLSSQGLVERNGFIQKKNNIKSKYNRREKFGKLYINMLQLSKNFLVIVNSSGKTHPSFGKQLITNSFVSLLSELINTTTFNEDSYNSLSDDEKILFDVLLSKSEYDSIPLHIMTKNTGKAKDKILNRFNVLRAQLLAGNNNPEIIKEIRTLLLKMMNENMITKQDFNSLISEIFLLI